MKIEKVIKEVQRMSDEYEIRNMKKPVGVIMNDMSFTDMINEMPKIYAITGPYHKGFKICGLEIFISDQQEFGKINLVI